MAAARAHGQSIEGFPPSQHERVTTVTRAALQLLTEWLGPSRFTTITVKGMASTPPSMATAQPGVVFVPVRWLLFERDRSLERDVITGLTRQYWLHNAPPTPFERAVVLYTAARAIHHLLEGSNFGVVRFFGGLIPFPLRSVLLSPPVADPRPRAWPFDHAPTAAEVLRIVRGLQTMERYVGWPAMAQALATMRAGGGALDANGFGATLSTVRGSDVTALVRECFRSDAVFDYAIANVRSTSSADGLFETSLTLVRQGSSIFEVGGDGDRERSMPVLVRFAEGTELRDWFDGAASSTTLVYTAKSPVVSAAIDPELMLLLDVNRANNTFSTASPIRPLGIRLALSWMAWLQHTMLSYTALV
jgi:hypothetical protein